MIKYILQNTTIARIRISSLWPEFIDDKLLNLFKNKRIYSYFHLSIQSASDKILQKMSRHYDLEFLHILLKKLNNLKKEDDINISLWADIIIWFPWETEEDFQETYDFIKKYNISKLHIFPFSSHKIWENIPAWNFKNQINEKIKKDRIMKLTKLWDDLRKDFKNSQKWKKLEVLIEKNDKNWNWSGWTQNYLEANNYNFNIIKWIVYKNNIIVWEFL